MSEEKKGTELSSETKAFINISSIAIGFLLAWAYKKENAENPTAIKVKKCVSAIIGFYC